MKPTGQARRHVAGVGNLLRGPGPLVIGILNVTPDSFSDGGDFFDPEESARHAAAMLEEGTFAIDVGGESTRPGSNPVSSEEERSRVIPVIRAMLAEKPEAIVSIDTYRSSTAEAALEAGASIINDVTAMCGDERMASLVADAGCPVALMHMLGEPRTMQRDPRYGDVVGEVRDFLAERAEYAISSGVAESNVVLDPGIGFGKTVEHNLTLLNNLHAIVDLGFPVLVGASRKRFIGALTGADDPKDRLFGTVATSVIAYERGATLFRVHDVRANSEALEVAAAVRRA